MDNKRTIVVCGPTAAGKTALAIGLAKKTSGELISADSRQIYQGMDIGTGKEISNFKFQISNKIQNQNKEKYKIGFYNINNAPIWLYDIIKPNQTFSAFEYAKLAKLVIGDIQKRKKTPIVVGGTGFYLKTLLDGLNTEGIEPDWKLRKKLNGLEIKKLKEMLQKLNSDKLESMNNSDRNNPRRLIRAIEVARKFSIFNLPDGKAGFQFSIKTQPLTTNHKLQNFIIVGLTAPQETLYRRIDERVDKRIKQGIVEEIKNLLSKGNKWSDPGMNCLGYKEWQPYLENKATKEEVVRRWKLDEHGFAKRQLTWFKKDKRIKWFNIEKTNSQNILAHVLRLLE